MRVGSSLHIRHTMYEKTYTQNSFIASKHNTRSAKFTSVVVVNFTNKRGSCYDFVRRTMKAAGEHGLEIPGVIKDIISDRDVQCLDQLTVHYNDNDAVDDVSSIYVSSKSLIIHRPS